MGLDRLLVLHVLLALLALLAAELLLQVTLANLHSQLICHGDLELVFRKNEFLMRCAVKREVLKI